MPPKCTFKSTVMPFFFQNINPHKFENCISLIKSFLNAKCDKFNIFLDSDIKVSPHISVEYMYSTAERMLMHHDVILASEMGSFGIPDSILNDIKQRKPSNICKDEDHDTKLKKVSHCRSRVGLCHPSRHMIFPNTGMIIANCSTMRMLLNTTLHKFEIELQKSGSQPALLKSIQYLNLSWSLDYCNDIMLSLHQLNVNQSIHIFNDTPIFHFNGPTKRYFRHYENELPGMLN